MTKNDILRYIEEIGDKLAELHRVVEQLPDTVQPSKVSPLPAPGRESTGPARSRVMQLVDKAALRSVVTKSFGEMNIHGEDWLQARVG
jgi:hypothetical protein